MAGSEPQNANDVNFYVGNLFREAMNFEYKIARAATWLAATDLKAEPYAMDAQEEAQIKGGVNALSAAIATADMTYVYKLAGLF